MRSSASSFQQRLRLILLTILTGVAVVVATGGSARAADAPPRYSEEDLSLAFSLLQDLMTLTDSPTPGRDVAAAYAHLVTQSDLAQELGSFKIKEIAIGLIKVFAVELDKVQRTTFQYGATGKKSDISNVMVLVEIASSLAKIVTAELHPDLVELKQVFEEKLGPFRASPAQLVLIAEARHALNLALEAAQKNTHSFYEVTQPQFAKIRAEMVAKVRANQDQKAADKKATAGNPVAPEKTIVAKASSEEQDAAADDAYADAIEKKILELQKVSSLRDVEPAENDDYIFTIALPGNIFLKARVGEFNWDFFLQMDKAGLDELLNSFLSRSEYGATLESRGGVIQKKVTTLPTAEKTQIAVRDSKNQRLTLDEIFNDILTSPNTEVEKLAPLVNAVRAQIAANGLGTDSEILAARQAQRDLLVGRDAEATMVLDTLQRHHHANVFIGGGVGVGKGTVLRKAIQNSLDGLYAPGGEEATQRQVERTYVIQVSAVGLMESGAVYHFLETIKNFNKATGLNLVLYMDDLHMTPKMAPYLKDAFHDKSGPGVSVIYEGPKAFFEEGFQRFPGFTSLFREISIAEDTEASAMKIASQALKPIVERTKNVKFTDAAIEAAVKSAKRVLPNGGRVDGAHMILQDAAVIARRQNRGEVQIDEDAIYAYVNGKMGFPVEALSGESLGTYRAQLLEKLNSEILGQPQMTEALVENWLDVLADNERPVRTGLIVGPKSVGKNTLAETFANTVAPSSRAIYTFDGAQMSDALGVLTKFRGLHGDTGEFIDWLEEDGRNGGVILIKEAHLACDDFWNELAPFMEGKGLEGGRLPANKHIVLVVSDEAKEQFLPKDAQQWSPELLQAHYRTLTPEKLREVLITRAPSPNNKDAEGLPRGVIEDADFITLANPMTRELLIQVGEKVATAWARSVQKQLGVAIHIQPELVQQLVETQYDILMGAQPTVKQQMLSYLNRAKREAQSRFNLKGAGSLTFELKADKKKPMIVIKAPGQPPIELAAPAAPADDPFDDEELMKTLDDLEAELNKSVYGQEDMVKTLADRVFTHRTKIAANRKRPLSMFVVGSTGIGKTEIAKALAKRLFGFEKAAFVQPLGDMVDKTKINTVFGSDKQYVGYGEPTPLEKHIQAYEKIGGVIVFDEASNMGGNDPALKEMLFKIFYDMVEEGRWTPPHARVTYDLSKFVFIFTGNDGEKMFQGIGGDQMRLEVWKEQNKRASLQKILRENGVPEAFLGRMVELILAKPLTIDVMKKIVHKFMVPVMTAYTSRNVKFEFAPDFYERMSKTLFAQSQGARSLRNFVEEAVPGYVGQLYRELKKQNLAGQPMVVKLELDDNLPAEPLVEDLSWKREVKFNVRFERDGQVLAEKSFDVKQQVPVKRRLGKRQAVATSWHEAGHAVTGLLAEKVLGTKTTYVTIYPEDEYLGYAYSEDLSEDVVGVHNTRNRVLNRMAMFLAGQRAQQLAGFETDEGWSKDLEMTRKAATQFLLNNGDPEQGRFMAILLDKEGKPILTGEQTKRLQKAMSDFMREADELAIQILLKNWTLTTLVTNQLVIEGVLTRDKLVALRKKAEEDKTEWVIGSDGRVVKKGTGSDSMWERLKFTAKKATRSYFNPFKTIEAPDKILSDDELNEMVKAAIHQNRAEDPALFQKIDAEAAKGAKGDTNSCTKAFQKSA